MNCGDPHVDHEVLFACGDLLLVRALPQLALNFDVSAFCKRRGKLGEFAPDHHVVPLGAAVVRARVALSTRLGSEGKVSHRSAVFRLAHFGIGADEPDEIDAILEHVNISFC